MKILSNFSGLKAYFIGIGGISMSGLAKILLSMGCGVSGSDLGKNNPEIEKLKSIGIRVNPEHSAKNIDQDIDFVVYTAAVDNSNPELSRAKDLNIPVYERAELLGMLSRGYSKVIAVSGTHGKTTTTAMLGEIFIHAGYNPTVHIGGVSAGLKSNTVIGGKEYLILEACEYCNSFRHIPSDTAVITNIEADHLDYYRDIEDIMSAFNYFAGQSQHIVIGKTVDISHKNRLVVGTDWEAREVEYLDCGYKYNVYYRGEFWAALRLNILGEYNITNSLFAIAVAVKYGIEKTAIIEAISRFRGVERRMEVVGKINDKSIIIDYAHHPTELRASMYSFGSCFEDYLVIFQPHTFSRTVSLMDDFVEALKGQKNLIIYKTYPAREEEIIGGRAEDLAERLGVRYVGDMDSIFDIIETATREGEISSVLVLGAGDLAEVIKTRYKSGSQVNEKW